MFKWRWRWPWRRRQDVPRCPACSRLTARRALTLIAPTPGGVPVLVVDMPVEWCPHCQRFVADRSVLERTADLVVAAVLQGANLVIYHEAEPSEVW